MILPGNNAQVIFFFYINNICIIKYIFVIKIIARPLEKTVPIKWLRKNQLKLEHIQNMKNAKNKTSVHLQYEGNELDQVTGKTLVQMLENPPIVR